MTEPLETAQPKRGRGRGKIVQPKPMQSPARLEEEMTLPLDPEEDQRLPKWVDGVPWRQQRPALNRARRLYYREYSYERIFLLVGIPPAIFLFFRNKWEKGRQKVDAKILEQIRNSKVADKADEFVAKGLEIGLKFLDRCIKRETEITAKDFKLITDAVMAIHRVAQLEKGAPTDIHAYETMTPEELSQYLIETRESLRQKHGELLVETQSYLPPTADAPPLEVEYKIEPEKIPLPKPKPVEVEAHVETEGVG